MNAPTALADSLRALDEDGLTRLLAHRPDAVRGLPPDDLDELAERLCHPRLIVAALSEVTLPHLQLTEAACALAPAARTTERVADLLDSETGRVVPLLDELAERGLLVRDGDRIVLPDATAELFGDPLGLGRPVAAQLEGHPVHQLQRLQRAFGLKSGARRAEVVESLLAFFAEPGNLARILEQAPPEVLDALRAHAEDEVLPWLNDPERYQQMRAALQWAQERGLVIAGQYSYTFELSAELVLALRGPDWHAPFDPDPPATQTPNADPAPRGSTLTQFASDLLEVVDHVNRSPVPLVKSGGVGVRELAKLAKACGADEDAVRLALELTVAAGVLEPDGGRLRAGTQFASWRSAAPAQQVSDVVQEWWTLGYAATESLDEDGKARRPLSQRGKYCHGCVAARRALVGTMAEHGPLEPSDLAALTYWRRPLVHVLAQDADRPFASVAREAELLGVIAGSSLTELGRALLAGDPDAVQAAAEGQLPATAERATFGSDLTAFVAGTPGAAVSTLLDSAADRESRGGAVTWRFSPGSVRRALDAGRTGEQLLEALTAVAEGELPQPLRYLIGDVARRHGLLQLSPATSVIRSEDSALLAEVAADRKLAKHGVRLLAPTVLAADVEVTTLLQALRAAGYFPVLEPGAASEADQPATGPRAAAGRRSATALRAGAGPSSAGRGPRGSDGPPGSSRQVGPPEPDLREIARGLLSANGRRRATTSLTARTLASLAPRLPASGVRLLAHAIDSGGRVGIDYISNSGARTSRVVSGPELAGLTLFAWCELRDAERVFTISRIESVYAAGAG